MEVISPTQLASQPCGGMLLHGPSDDHRKREGATGEQEGKREEVRMEGVDEIRKTKKRTANWKKREEEEEEEEERGEEKETRDEQEKRDEHKRTEDDEWSEEAESERRECEEGKGKDDVRPRKEESEWRSRPRKTKVCIDVSQIGRYCLFVTPIHSWNCYPSLPYMDVAVFDPTSHPCSAFGMTKYTLRTGCEVTEKHLLDEHGCLPMGTSVYVFWEVYLEDGRLINSHWSNLSDRQGACAERTTTETSSAGTTPSENRKAKTEQSQCQAIGSTELDSGRLAPDFVGKPELAHPTSYCATPSSWFSSASSSISSSSSFPLSPTASRFCSSSSSSAASSSSSAASSSAASSSSSSAVQSSSSTSTSPPSASVLQLGKRVTLGADDDILLGMHEAARWFKEGEEAFVEMGYMWGLGHNCVVNLGAKERKVVTGRLWVRLRVNKITFSLQQRLTAVGDNAAARAKLQLDDAKKLVRGGKEKQALKRINGCLGTTTEGLQSITSEARKQDSVRTEQRSCNNSRHESMERDSNRIHSDSDSMLRLQLLALRMKALRNKLVLVSRLRKEEDVTKTVDALLKALRERPLFKFSTEIEPVGSCGSPFCNRRHRCLRSTGVCATAEASEGTGLSHPYCDPEQHELEHASELQLCFQELYEVAFYHKACYLERTQKYGEAFEEFRKLALMRPTDTKVKLHLKQCQEKKGCTEEGRLWKLMGKGLKLRHHQAVFEVSHPVYNNECSEATKSEDAGEDTAPTEGEIRPEGDCGCQAPPKQEWQTELL